MKNLKKELFDFKKNLTFEQDDIEKVVEAHYQACDNSSEKAIIQSLNERLNPYTYDESVKGLLEGLNDDMMNFELLYNLKDLYRMVEKRNLGGTIYRQPLNTLLQIINLTTDDDRMTKILNELAVYDWVPEIKVFLHNITKNPEKKANLLNGGDGQTVFTIVEAVEDGHIAFVRDSWFLLKEDSIEKTTLDVQIKDEEKVRVLNALQNAMNHAEISEERIDFKISENLVIGLSTKNPGTTFINEEKTDKETTLENLFQSPIIPIVNKNYYPLIMEVASNMDKFVELDVVKKVTNLANPFVDIYAMNYKDNMYMYRCDSRYGNSFFKYESAMEVIDDIRNEMNYDLTYFYEDKLSEEVKLKKQLEDKEREIQMNIEDIDKNAEKVEANLKMMGESEVLSKALDSLRLKREEMEAELLAIKELKYNEVVQK
jgi:hypothetical protein